MKLPSAYGAKDGLGHVASIEMLHSQIDDDMDEKNISALRKFTASRESHKVLNKQKR